MAEYYLDLNGLTHYHTDKLLPYLQVNYSAVGHKHSAADITSGTLSIERGGTGKTTLKDAANSFLNALDTGSSTPVDADYYISQYVNGGTTTTTYHRRPMSALYSYVQGKADNRYLKLSGGTMTGGVTFVGNQSSVWNTVGINFTGGSTIGESSSGLGIAAGSGKSYIYLRIAGTTLCQLLSTGFIPSTNNSISLGSSSYFWKEAYISKYYITNTNSYMQYNSTTGCLEIVT